MAVILITGSNRGIGMATAVHLAKGGHRVYASMRDLARGKDLQSAVEANNLSIETIRLDVNDEKSVEEAVSVIISKERRIDVLINNAGIGPLRSVEETDESMAKAVFETNFFGSLRCIRAVLPFMRGQKSGTIVNISSLAGRVAAMCTGIYSASKFALEAASESLAQEVLPYGIRVRLIEPGFIITPILDVAIESLSTETVYPKAAHRMQFLYSQAKQTGDSPHLVAETIGAAINSTEPKLRFEVGGGASVFIGGRSKMTDEEWIAMGRHETEEDFLSEFTRRFPLY